MPDSGSLSQPRLERGSREVTDYFAQHAAEVDRGARDVRDGLRWLAARDLLGLGLEPDGPDGLLPMGELIAQIAEQCVSSAFAVWCHRMVMEYVTAAAEPFPRASVLGRLASVDVLGSTALGTAMAHVVMGSPLTVRFQTDAEGLILSGRITWASNLLSEPEAAITVTAATDDDGRRIVVAVPLDTPGVKVSAYPQLLALQSTRSSSVVLDQVRVHRRWIVADDLKVCLARIRPRFLTLQSSFCLGLSRAALRGIQAELGEWASVFGDEYERLSQQFSRLESRLRSQLREPTTAHFPMREFVQMRLDVALLAQAATRLELTLRGGRAYRLDDPAGRRFREAAFLPIQAPTEGQLRWELAHSA